MGLVYFIILLGVIVFIHELGHFIAAKAFNVYVSEFAIGMGPKLFSIQGKETLYSIRMIPLGGFCQMAGEVDNALEGENIFENVPSERMIKGVNRFKQFIIMIAGIVMNFVLAWVIFSGIYIFSGVDVPVNDPIVGQVLPNSPADIAGIKTNDKIVKVQFSDGSIIEPKTFEEIAHQDEKINNEQKTYTILRDGSQLTITVDPVYDEALGQYWIGIYASTQKQSVSIIDGLILGAKQMYYTTTIMLDSLKQLLVGKNLDQLSGPVGIYTITKQQASLGIENYLWLIAVVSLNIGIMNALPLPILDGGRVILLIYEAITRKAINQKVEQALMLVAVFLLFGLMIFATWQDIIRIFQ